MRLGSWLFRATLATGVMLLASQSLAPQTASIPPESKSADVRSAATLPDAPLPLFEAAPVKPLDWPDAAVQTDTASADSSSQSPSQSPSQQTSQTPAQQSDSDKSQHDKAEEQLKQQEHQRVMGVMATFNTTRDQNALPLSPGQKFRLFFKSSTDPWPFLLAGVVSGLGQADDSYPEWGQGAQGYAKRFGAAYSDAFIGNFFGNAVLPSLLHEDPRYFQKGTGSSTKRFLWAAASTVWCKRDKGSWGPNYANVGGNLIGAAISRAYYPSSERSVGDVFSDGLTVSAEGIVGAEVIEFWPDLVRHHRRKQAEKLARQAAQTDAHGAAKSAPQSAPAGTSPKQNQN
jgi:hypothetical protein